MRTCDTFRYLMKLGSCNERQEERRAEDLWINREAYYASLHGMLQLLDILPGE